MVAAKTNQTSTTVWLCLVLALLLTLVGYAQHSSDQALTASYQIANLEQIPLKILPSAPALRQIDLGFHRAVADIVWLSTIQYVGGGNPNAPYGSLYALLDTTVTLDPTFEYPYLFGGILLPWQGNPHQALDLLQRGSKQFPNNGLFPYNAGAVAKIHLKDNVAAAEFYRTAIGKENTPPAAALLAGVSLTNMDDRAFALTWWKGLYESETNPTIKERARVWMTHLQLIIDLETVVARASAEGHTVYSLSDLVTLHYLKAVPQSPLEVPLEYYPDTEKVEIDRRFQK